MDIHSLQPKTPLKSRKVIGRGGKKGTYSGKGMKGQKARSGAHISPLFAGGAPTLMGQGSQTTHIMRGQKNIVNLTKKNNTTILNIKGIDKVFSKGETVNIESLIERGLIKKRVNIVKILAKGESKNKFVFENLELSKTVQEKYSL